MTSEEMTLFNNGMESAAKICDGIHMGFAAASIRAAISAEAKTPNKKESE